MVKKFILFRNEKLLITRFYLEELEGVFCPKKGLISHSTMHKQLMGEKNGMPACISTLPLLFSFHSSVKTSNEMPELGYGNIS